MLEFHFRLFDDAELAARGIQPTSWFTLSTGWYFLRLGDVDLPHFADLEEPGDDYALAEVWGQCVDALQPHLSGPHQPWPYVRPGVSGIDFLYLADPPLLIFRRMGEGVVRLEWRTSAAHAKVGSGWVEVEIGQLTADIVAFDRALMNAMERRIDGLDAPAEIIEQIWATHRDNDGRLPSLLTAALR
ncbi:DUF5984 family protein [Cnuibacter sp. UC19_7]|uniref:DUF5984 family protein n=1 Tax=Cnuibacter sp. UC19_7 TaxID=3350166 RepID=UPI00366FF493